MDISPSNIPDYALWKRSSLATLVNSDGSIGFCPHNLLPNSKNLTAAAGWSVGANLSYIGTETIAGVQGYKYQSNGTSNSYLAVNLPAHSGIVYSLSFICDKNIWCALRANGTNTNLSTMTSVLQADGTYFVSGSIIPNEGTSTITVHLGAIDASAGTTFVVANPQFNAGPLQKYLITDGTAFYGIRAEDYSTGKRECLLEKYQATNLITNNTVPLINGTGGTHNGVTTSIVGRGIEDGIPYIDVRFQGVPTGSAMCADWGIFGTTTRIDASAEVSYALTWYVRKIKGPLNAKAKVYLVAENASLGYLTLSPSITKNQSAYSICKNRELCTMITPPTTSKLRIALAMEDMVPNLPFDCVVRFGGGQLELGNIPTSLIFTSNSSVTRTEDKSCYSRTTLVTQMYADGTMGYGPHNLVQNSEMFGTQSNNFPVSWFVAQTPQGCTAKSIGIYVIDGVRYLAIRCQGTATNWNAWLFESNVISVKTGRYTYRIRAKVSGANDGIGFSGGGVGASYTPISTNGTVQCVTYSLTSGTLYPRIRCPAAQGKTYDFTLYIAEFQVAAGDRREYTPTFGSAVYGLRTQDYSDATQSYVYGQEIVSNGDFSNGVTGWYFSNASYAVNNKICTITNTTGEASIILPALPASKWYEFTIEITGYHNQGNFYFVPTGNGSPGNIPKSSIGVFTGVFYTGDTSITPRLSTGTAVTGHSLSIKSISLKEIIYRLPGTPSYGPELVVNGDFSNGTTGWYFSNDWSLVNGFAQHTSGSAGTIEQNILTDGDLYIASWDQSDNLAINAMFGDTYAGTSPINGKCVVIGRAIGTTFRLQGGGSYTGIKNISVKKLSAAASNAAIKMEVESTNLSPHSTVCGTGWNTIEAGVGISYNYTGVLGNPSATKYLSSAGYVGGYIGSFAAGTYVASVYIKQGSVGTIELGSDSGAEYFALLNTNTMQITNKLGTGKVEFGPNGWYRFSCKFTAANSCAVVCYLCGIGNVILDGFQLEQSRGEALTGLIPSNGTATSRDTEVWAIPVEQIPGWNSSRATFALQYNAPPSITTSMLLSVNGYEIATLRHYQNTGLGTWDGVGEINAPSPAAISKFDKWATSLVAGTSRAMTHTGTGINKGALSANALSCQNNRNLYIGTYLGWASYTGSLYRIQYWSSDLPDSKLLALVN